MGTRDYSTTAASNLSVGGISIAEGMARSSVNNALRSMLSDTANLLLDLGGATATTGSANAYLLALDSAPTAYADNMLFLATSHATNTGAATINVNGVGVKPLKRNNMGSVEAFTGGEFPVGHVGIFIYSTSNNACLMLNAATSVLMGANFGFFENRAEAEAAHIPAGVNMVETLSYAAPGDGGGARYKRIATPTYTYLGDFEDAGGRWWQHAPSGTLRAAEYGVAGGASLHPTTGVWSGTDVEPQIKDALYQSIYKLRGGPVELPIGNLFVERGIHLGYGDVSRGAHLRGVHRGHNYQDYPATTLVWNFTDEPLLSIQGARGTTVENLSFSGPGRQYIEDNQIGEMNYNGAVGDDTLLETWTDPTWLPQASSRYAPSVVVAVDPRVGPASSPFYYRDVDYPAEMGAIPQYNKSLSSDVIIRDFNIYGGGQVAIVVQPNENSDGNGDFVRIYNSNIYNMPVGISISQTQARLTLLDSVDFTRAHTCITTNMHGKQQGVFAEARNCHFGGIKVFDFNDTSTAGHITINGYGEELWKVGDVTTTTSSATKLVLHQLKLSFASQNPALRGVPATMIGGGGVLMPLEINGGSWVYYWGCAVIDKDIRGVTIDGLLMEPAPPANKQEMCFINGTAGGLVFPQLGFGAPIENIHPKFFTYDLDAGTGLGTQMVGDVWRSNRVICTPLWVQRHGESGRRDEGVVIPERISPVEAGSTFTVTSMSGLTLTTNWAGRTDQLYMLQGPQEGDILYHPATQSTFVCMSANQTTDVVTFKLLNNYKNGNVPRDPPNFTANPTCYLGNLRCYSPNTAIYGIITASSNVITDCGLYHEGAYDNGFQNSALLATDIAVDDYLFVDRDLEPYIGTSTDTRITAINTGANTLTIAGNALHGTGGKRVRLGTFVRPGVL